MIQCIDESVTDAELATGNRDRERQDPDMIRPPSTDHGAMLNMKW